MSGQFIENQDELDEEFALPDFGRHISKSAPSSPKHTRQYERIPAFWDAHATNIWKNATVF